MKFYIGVTDYNWFRYLANEQPDELNFWQPGGRQSFKAIQADDLFLFKLHSPNNFIVGGGFFVRHSFLPVSLSWEAFGNKNGTSDYLSFRNAIHKYRKSDFRSEPDPTIGCIILSMPFFFDKKDWIPVPEDWKPNIVQGKTYDTDTEIGHLLYSQVQTKLHRYSLNHTEILMEKNEANRYGSEQIIHPRIGQGTFKIMVTEAYHRRCAITGEKTLPVLEAAHIKPYSQNGPHMTSNGLLLRKDIHTLFDRGYITINADLHIEVSKRIKEDYGNGREYYAFHGKSLAEVPDNINEKPSIQYLRWHNENVYLA
ncbi:HNH endonuclease [Cohnella zeiphila]|uniref:HNH endonuclease n=1 Tax=Cohnella zeiphila TaxID=2761120 RepID=A0A7X0SQD7_9BACL|nr:HNH endonuclease [Cohnella zeiphila]MBB6734051.1 HNH endonuclease [Cohnella zeiphila]